MLHRPSARWTALVLVSGTLIAVAGFVAAFSLRLIGQPSVADTIAGAAVIVLIGTPVSGLVVTSAELRRVQLPAALLAILVLVILAAATVLAVLTSR